MLITAKCTADPGVGAFTAGELYHAEAVREADVVVAVRGDDGKTVTLPDRLFGRCFTAVKRERPSGARALGGFREPLTDDELVDLAISTASTRDVNQLEDEIRGTILITDNEWARLLAAVTADPNQDDDDAKNDWFGEQARTLVQRLIDG